LPPVLMAVRAMRGYGPEDRRRDLNRGWGKSVRGGGRVLSYAIGSIYGTD
jgi:hypothetical protein